MNGDTLVTEDKRKMIPVDGETHRRVMMFAGKLTSQRGTYTSMGDAVSAALDIAESAAPATSKPEADNVAA